MHEIWQSQEHPWSCNVLELSAAIQSILLVGESNMVNMMGFHWAIHTTPPCRRADWHAVSAYRSDERDNDADAMHFFFAPLILITRFQVEAIDLAHYVLKNCQSGLLTQGALAPFSPSVSYRTEVGTCVVISHCQVCCYQCSARRLCFFPSWRLRESSSFRLIFKRIVPSIVDQSTVLQPIVHRC